MVMERNCWYCDEYMKDMYSYHRADRVQETIKICWTCYSEVNTKNFTEEKRKKSSSEPW